MRKAKTITKRELNQRTARVLAGIRAGRSVVVTERGVPKWRIEAIGDADDPVARLIAEGRIKPASKNPPPWPVYSEEQKRGRTPADVDALYAEMRGDR